MSLIFSILPLFVPFQTVLDKFLTFSHQQLARFIALGYSGHGAHPQGLLDWLCCCNAKQDRDLAPYPQRLRQDREKPEHSRVFHPSEASRRQIQGENRLFSPRIERKNRRSTGHHSSLREVWSSDHSRSRQIPRLPQTH